MVTFTLANVSAQVTIGLLDEFKFNGTFAAETDIASVFGFNPGTSFTTDRNNNANSAIHINNYGTSATILNLPYGTSARSFSFWVKLDEYNAGGYNFAMSYGTANNSLMNGVSVSGVNNIRWSTS
jgi:hypothetical protein